jgi:hypothetical protein
MRKLMAFVAVSCCIASAGSRGAKSATLSVDPKNSCFDLTIHQLFGTTLTFFPLANGKYTVSMTSTANLGTSGSALNKVYFHLETPNRPFSSLNIVSTMNPNNVVGADLLRPPLPVGPRPRQPPGRSLGLDPSRGTAPAAHRTASRPGMLRCGGRAGVNFLRQ